MARKLTFEDREGITYDVFVIRFDEDGWEDEWACIEHHPELDTVREMISEITWDAYQKALSGWPGPLSDQLDYEPEDCFIRVRDDLKTCEHKDNCVDHRPDACGPHLEFPVCFMASLDADFDTRAKLTRIYEYWASGRWVCLVPMSLEQDVVDTHGSD